MKVLIIGAGHRVKEALLPVLLNRKEDFDIIGIYSREHKLITVLDNQFEVDGISELDRKTVLEADLIYISVPALAIPNILTLLESYSGTNLSLVIDTPGLHVKNIDLIPKLLSYRRCWIAEDIVKLPWLDLLSRHSELSATGKMKKIHLDQAGWEYHGIALCKKLFCQEKLVSAKNRKRYPLKEKQTVELLFSHGGRANIINPRDYEKGNITIEYETCSVTTDLNSDELKIECIVDNQVCQGFRIGKLINTLQYHEKLIFGVVTDKTIHIVENMHNCKRVGLSRFLDDIVNGYDVYGVIESQEDLWITYFMATIGRWKRVALFNVNSSLFRFTVSLMWKTINAVKRIKF
jgi:hypothetical protein